jgi:membrane fusion protein, multidrug efflux system
MSRIKWAVLGVAAIALLLGGAAMLTRGTWGNKASADQAGKGSQTQARTGFPVETSKARLTRSSEEIRAIGSLQSDESVKIAAELPGRIAEILFREGQPVKQDDVLVKLDDTLVRAEVADAEARHGLAQANLDRANQLARSGSGTERTRDEAIAASGQGRAALELAKARLDKHTIRAPFSGTAGLRGVSVGAFINTGTEVVALEKIDQLKVDFSIPETLLNDVKIGQTIDVTVDALPERTFSGTIYAIAPIVDVNGRSLRMRGRLSNAEGILRPGLFARVTIRASEQQVVMVPESAVMPRGGESFVYRIENGRAVETKVELGIRKAGEVEVRNGLTAETVVVTAGQQRLRDGAAVNVVASADGASG